MLVFLMRRSMLQMVHVPVVERLWRWHCARERREASDLTSLPALVQTSSSEILSPKKKVPSSKERKCGDL